MIDPTTILEINQNPPNHSGCSFCKAGRGKRKFFFANEPRDCYICEVCVTVMAQKLTEVRQLVALDTTTMRGS